MEKKSHPDSKVVVDQKIGLYNKVESYGDSIKFNNILVLKHDVLTIDGTFGIIRVSSTRIARHHFSVGHIYFLSLKCLREKRETL